MWSASGSPVSPWHNEGVDAMSDWIPAKLIRQGGSGGAKWTIQGPNVSSQGLYGLVPEDVRNLDYGGRSRVELACEIQIANRLVAAIRITDAGILSTAAAAHAEREKAEQTARAEKEAADRKAKADKEKAEAEKGVPFPLPTDTRSKKGPDHFHNPYNFIPAPEGVPSSASQLGHRPPAGHDRYHPDLWTGSIDVELTAATPVLMLDAAARRMSGPDGQHPVYPVLERNGRAHIPPTSLKGPLRAAYEAVTVSRFPVWKKHAEKLGRRMQASEGLAMVPARISDDGGALELFLGPHWVDPLPRLENVLPKRVGNNWEPPGKYAYAAWLRSYIPNRSSAPAGGADVWISPEARSVRGNSDLQPRRIVWARLQRVWKNDGNRSFGYWSVEEISGTREGLSNSRTMNSARIGKHAYSPGQHMIAWGYVCQTGQNFRNKHDERFFFLPEGQKPHRIEIDGTRMGGLKSDWADLMADYGRTAADNRRGRGGADDARYLGSVPGRTAMSRHVYDPLHSEFGPGLLCYARFEQGRLTGLYPVQIARELAEWAPDAFLPENVRPAKSRDELSTADRVFGWVSQKEGVKDGTNMHRGQLRIRRIDFCRCPESDTGLEKFGTALPLAILGQPKPQQFGFYLGKDKAGSPLDGLDPRTKFYSANVKAGGGRLRGRKVYPHHKAAAGLADYWNPGRTAQEKLADGKGRAFFREFIHPADGNNRLTNQNRSVEGWIRRGAVFRATIDVVNLADAELGALLWLLTQEGAHLRLGYGKPLGFGSMTTTVTGGSLRRGADLADEYRGLAEKHCNDGVPGPDHPTVQAYRDALAGLFSGGGAFEANPVVAAYLASARGFDSGLPVHYPRGVADSSQEAGTNDGTVFSGAAGGVKPSRDGENFHWFVANKKYSATLGLLDAAGAPLPYLQYKA